MCIGVATYNEGALVWIRDLMTSIYDFVLLPAMSY